MRTAVSPWSAPKRSAAVFPAGFRSWAEKLRFAGSGRRRQAGPGDLSAGTGERGEPAQQPRHPEFLAGGGGRHRLFADRRLGSPAGGKVYPRPGGQPSDGGLYVAYPGAHPETGGGACHPDQLCAGGGTMWKCSASRWKTSPTAPSPSPPTGAVPLYGRSADNLRDHRNVTSMLHRIRTTPTGCGSAPPCPLTSGATGPTGRSTICWATVPTGQAPAAFYPHGGGVHRGGAAASPIPGRCWENYPGVPAGACRAGREAMGAFRFAPLTLAPGASARYICCWGWRRATRPSTALCPV